MFFSFAVGSSVVLQGTVNVQSLFKVNLIYPNFWYLVHVPEGQE